MVLHGLDNELDYNGSSSSHTVPRKYNDILRRILENIQNYDTRVINLNWVNDDNFERVAALLYEQTRQYMLNLLQSQHNEVASHRYIMYDNTFNNQLAFPAFCIELVKKYDFTIAKICDLLYFLNWKISDNLFFELYADLLDTKHSMFKTVRAQWIAAKYPKFSNFIENLAIQNWNIEIYRLFFEKFMFEFNNQDQDLLIQVLTGCKVFSNLDTIELFSKSTSLKHLVREIGILEGIKYVEEICAEVDHSVENETIFPLFKKLYFDNPEAFKEIWNILKALVAFKNEQFIPAKVCNIIMYSLEQDLHEVIQKGDIDIRGGDVSTKILKKMQNLNQNVRDYESDEDDSDESENEDEYDEPIDEPERTDDEVHKHIKTIKKQLKKEDPKVYKTFNNHDLLIKTVFKLCRRVNSNLPPTYTSSKSFNTFPPGSYGGKELSMLLISLVYAAYGGEIRLIDLVTYNDVAAKNLYDNIKQYFNDKNIPICLAKDYASLANQNSYKVRVGTLQELLKLDLHVTNFDNRVLLIDNSDYFLFENPIVNHTNQLSTLGTQNIFSILKYILDQVKEKYQLHKQHVLENKVYFEPTEKEFLLYLKGSFTDSTREMTNINSRAKKVEEKFNKFTESKSYDSTGSVVEDIFETSRMFYRDDVNEYLTTENLKKKLPKDVDIIMGPVDSEVGNRKVWIQFNHNRDIKAFKRKNNIWNAIKLKVKRNQVSKTSGKNAVDIFNDVEHAKEIIRRLDRERGVQNCFLDSIEDNDVRPVLHRASAKRELNLKPYLDKLIFYLRYVHLYCFYSCTQYCDMQDMLENGFYPTVRSSKTSPNNRNRVPRVVQKSPDRYFESGYLLLELSDMIDNLPLILKRYCVTQLDKWVEASYNVVLRNKTDADGINKTIMDDFSCKDYNLLLRNGSTPNMPNSGYDKLFAYNSIQDDEYRQIYELQNNLSLTPISIPTRYTHIQEIIERYPIVHCFSEPCFSESNPDFSKAKEDVLKKIFEFDEINHILPHFQEVPVYKFPSLLYEEYNSWMEAILINIIHQLQLQNNVFVFCESDHIIYAQFIPKLISKIERHSLVETVSIITEETQDTFISRNLAVIFATPKSARDINYKLHQDGTVAGNHICMTFVPVSRIQEEYCVTKNLIGDDNYMNTYQYIIHHDSVESINSTSDIIQERDQCDIEYFNNKVVAQPAFKELQLNLETLLKDNEEEEKPIGQFDSVNLQQAHAFWMKSNVEKIYTEEIETLLDDHTCFIQDFKSNFVFLAREIFFLINGEYDRKMRGRTNSDAPDEDESYIWDDIQNVEKILDSSIGKEYKSININSSFSQYNASTAMALYYYAGFKIKKDENNNFSRVLYKEVLKMFELSKLLIEKNIAAVYTELSNKIENKSELKQIITVVSKFIDILIKGLEEIINKLTLQTQRPNLDMALESILMPAIDNYKETDATDAANKTHTTDAAFAKALIHCKSFGFYGTIHLNYYDYHIEEPVEVKEKVSNEWKSSRFGLRYGKIAGRIRKAVHVVTKQVTEPFKSERTHSIRNIESEGVLENYLGKIGRSIEHHGTWLYTMANKSSREDELIFEDISIPEKLQNLANAFRLVIYFMDEIYIFPVDSTPVGTTRLSFSQTGSGILWKSQTRDSFDLYDLFFGLFKCYSIEAVYDGFDKILKGRENSRSS